MRNSLKSRWLDIEPMEKYYLTMVTRGEKDMEKARSSAARARSTSARSFLVEEVIPPGTKETPAATVPHARNENTWPLDFVVLDRETVARPSG
jgi:hypothetical protein